ncbi:DinB family protein [Paenibacillus sp. ACRRX]|uniref:DinB family protein n=1 Tax=Paenibacillus sp. ACRRX TaxID=2918206 RepID=UPI001EF47438|nr:DinB family protein [Paenibacillus sp. ACRRX]MCG7408203.1 DinB family protein [Paenibacillus sp. ACRRX]
MLKVDVNERLSQTVMEIRQLLGQYELELGRYSAEQLTAVPIVGSWSIGQVYNHLIDATLRLHLRAIDQCAAAEETTGGAKTEGGEVIYRAGAFPPIKIKVPDSAGYTPLQPTDRQQLIDGLHQVSFELDAAQRTAAGSDPQSKVEHPGLGWLNAEEWLQLVKMHFNHHLRQKAELDAALGMSAI